MTILEKLKELEKENNLSMFDIMWIYSSCSNCKYDNVNCYCGGYNCEEGLQDYFNTEWRYSMNDKCCGTEGNITYEVIENGDIINITVKNTDTNVCKHLEYECNYRPIFGYDVEDIYNVNIELDKMIDELKGEVK